MAHRIEKRDKQQGREMGWHRLTEIVTDLNLENNWLRKWDIQEVPLYINPNDNLTEVPFKVLTATDDYKVIGKPFATTYRPISNKMFLDMIQEAISNIDGATVESVGSVCNRGRVFVSISIKDYKKFNIGHREFNDYLNFGNGHDQTCVLWVNNTNICTVCNNTFTLNLHDKKSAINARVHHRGDIETSITNIEEIIKGYFESRDFFKQEFERLMEQPLDTTGARNLFAGWTLRNDDDKMLTVKSLNKVNRLTELFNTGAGNLGNSRADAFSAITDFFTHESTRKGGANTGNQFVSSEFGIGRSAKENFWNVVRDEELMVDYTTIGKFALENV